MIDWHSLLERVVVGGGIPVRFEYNGAVRSAFLDATLVAVASVPDRNTGESIKVQMQVPIPHYIKDEHDAVEFVLSLAQDLYRHELREQFCVDGKRFTDPHALPKAMLHRERIERDRVEF